MVLERRYKMKAKWGAFWIFIFVAVIYVLLNEWILTPVIDMIKSAFGW